jgi:tetratricopeptide (TPR) repeat protein
MFEASNPYESLGDTVTARVLLERGVEQADGLHEQPVLQSQLYGVVGRVYRELGEYEQAHPLLKKALQIRTEQNINEPIELADTYYNLGTVAHHMGDYRESDFYFEQALEIYGQYPEYRSAGYANSLHMMADMMNIRRDHDSAKAMHTKALGMRKILFGDSHPNVGKSYQSLGYTHYLQGRMDSAEEYLVKAGEIFRENYSDEHPATAALLLVLAAVQQQKGEYEMAEKNLVTSLNIREKVFGKNHIETGLGLKALADFYNHRGSYSKAERMYAELLEMIEAEPEGTQPLRRPAIQALGRLYLHTGSPDRAKPFLDEAHNLLKNVLSKSHPRVLSAGLDLGECLVRLEMFSEAENILYGYMEVMQDYSSGVPEELKKEYLQLLINMYESRGYADTSQIYRKQLSELLQH